MALLPDRAAFLDIIGRIYRFVTAILLITRFKDKSAMLQTTFRYAFILLGMGFLVTSCEKAKDWDCKCTYTEDGAGKSRTIVINERKKAEAKDLCVTSLVSGPGVTDAACNLED